MKKLPVPAMLVLALLLAGCENNAASYQIDGNKDHSISLMREQSLPFGPVAQRFVVLRAPVCQRRFTVEDSPAEMDKVSLYEVAPRLYAAQQGKNWYALGTEACQVQVFSKEDRPETPPGRLLGTFEKQGSALHFVPAAPEDGAGK